MLSLYAVHRYLLGGKNNGNKKTDQPVSLIQTLISLLFDPSDPFVDTLGSVADLATSQWKARRNLRSYKEWQTHQVVRRCRRRNSTLGDSPSEIAHPAQDSCQHRDASMCGREDHGLASTGSTTRTRLDCGALSSEEEYPRCRRIAW